MPTSIKKFFLLTAFLLGSQAWNAQAALQAVGPVDEATGFPVWYEDTNNLRLDLCADLSGMCLFDLPDPNAPVAVPDNFPAEAFWWLAEIAGMPVGAGDASLVLAMEAAFAPSEVAVEGLQQAFARIRIRITPPVSGDYTITHPFGQITLPGLVGGDTTTVTQDIGNLADPGRDGDFTQALNNDPAQAGIVNADGRSIGPFLVPAQDDGTPLPFIQVPGFGTYIANPGQLNRVVGSPIPDAADPSGFQNYFRVEGPGVTAESDLFNVLGKVSNCDPANVAPVAGDDLAAALGGTAVINVIANDTDDAAVNPTAIAIVSQGTKGTATRNLDGTVTYTANAGASGTDTFTYTVQDFCGLPSNAATVTVLVEPAETLAGAQADFRTGLGKWLIRGTSSIPEPTVRLTGAGEVPPVASNARGFAMVDINAAGDAINYALLIDQAAASDFTVAHIHVGAPDVVGPPIFFLCGSPAPACPTSTGLVQGALMAAELVPQAAAGIETFADALAAIRSGRAYVNAHTVNNPGGEIRGQVGNYVSLRTGAAGSPLVGTALVQPDGSWTLDAKSTASPGSDPRAVQGSSTTGAAFTIPLRLR